MEMVQVTPLRRGQHLFPNPNAIDAISKGMLELKLYSNNIL